MALSSVGTNLWHKWNVFVLGDLISLWYTEFTLTLFGFCLFRWRRWIWNLNLCYKFKFLLHWNERVFQLHLKGRLGYDKSKVFIRNHSQKSTRRDMSSCWKRCTKLEENGFRCCFLRILWKVPSDRSKFLLHSLIAACG